MKKYKIYKSGDNVKTKSIMTARGEKDGYASDVWVIKDLGNKLHVHYGSYMDECIIHKDSLK